MAREVSYFVWGMMTDNIRLKNMLEVSENLKRYIAFLRGINISGKNKVPMAELKQGFEKLDFGEVKTYLNSGNVIFSSDEDGAEKFTNQIEVMIKKRFGLDIPVFVISKEELENKIATFTGGRVAEELVFGDVTTGASNDIEQATKLARAIITRYGMSEFGMVAMESLNNVYLGGDTSMSCSQETAAKIDDLVVALVQKQYEKAKNLLNSHMDKLHEISKFLYEHETITGEEFMEILNRPQIVAQD